MGIVGEGIMGRVARGVPECFVSGKVVRKVEEKKEKEVKREDGGSGGPVATVGGAAPAPPVVAVSPAPSAKKDTLNNAP